MQAERYLLVIMRKGFLLLTLIVMSVLGMSTGLARAVPAPESYSRVTANGQYLLVMLSSSDYTGSSQAAELKRKYTKSGLYPIDGSSSAVWTIDSFIYATDLELSSDGRYLIHKSGLTFYDNGKKLKKYAPGELVSNFRPADLPVGAVGGWIKRAYYEEASQRFFVETVQNDKYEFEVVSGDIVKVARAGAAGGGDLNFEPGLLLITGLIATGLALLALVFFSSKKRFKFKKSN